MRNRFLFALVLALLIVIILPNTLPAQVPQRERALDQQNQLPRDDFDLLKRQRDFVFEQRDAEKRRQEAERLGKVDRVVNSWWFRGLVTLVIFGGAAAVKAVLSAIFRKDPRNEELRRFLAMAAELKGEKSGIANQKSEEKPQAKHLDKN
jgi:hypothetical protein